VAAPNYPGKTRAPACDDVLETIAQALSHAAAEAADREQRFSSAPTMVQAADDGEIHTSLATECIRALHELLETAHAEAGALDAGWQSAADCVEGWSAAAIALRHRLANWGEPE
jgi:hypothetical protein